MFINNQCVHFSCFLRKNKFLLEQRVCVPLTCFLQGIFPQCSLQCHLLAVSHHLKHALGPCANHSCGRLHVIWALLLLQLLSQLIPENKHNKYHLCYVLLLKKEPMIKANINIYLQKCCWNIARIKIIWNILILCPALLIMDDTPLRNWHRTWKNLIEQLIKYN